MEARTRHGKGQLRDRMKLVGFLFSKKQGCAGLEVKHATVKKAFLQNWSIAKMLKHLALKNVTKPSDVQKIPSGTLPTKTESVTKFLDFPTKVLFFRWDSTCMSVATCLGSAAWSHRDGAASILKSAILMELIVWGVYFKDWVNNDSQREDHIVLFVHLSVYENIFIFQQPLLIGLKFPLIGRFCLHIHSSIHRLKARSAALEMFQKGKLAKIQAQMFQMENR